MMVVPRVVRSSVVGFGAVLGAYESLTQAHAWTFQKLKLKRKKAGGIFHENNYLSKFLMNFYDFF